MPDIDLFFFFRWGLSILVTVYCTLVMVRSAWGWIAWLRGDDRYISLVRRYIIVQALRLRLGAFGGDLLVCGLLCVVFILVWMLHPLVEEGYL